VNTATDDLGPHLQLTFSLDPGSYATTLLREICKTDIA
jgi:tRNA(Glu) U13 pseudouridine synthase TruD